MMSLFEAAGLQFASIIVRRTERRQRRPNVLYSSLTARTGVSLLHPNRPLSSHIHNAILSKANEPNTGAGRADDFDSGRRLFARQYIRLNPDAICARFVVHLENVSKFTTSHK